VTASISLFPQVEAVRRRSRVGSDMADFAVPAVTGIRENPGLVIQ
jgi:hypothetical protein